MKSFLLHNRNRLIGIAAVLVLLAAAGLLAFRLVRAQMEQPVRDLLEGIEQSDTQRMIGALPEPVSEMISGGNDAIFKSLDSSFDDINEELAKRFVSGEFTLDYKVFDREKLNGSKIDEIEAFYKDMDMDVSVEKAYWLSLNITATGGEETLPLTLGVVVGKVDGSWHIVYGDKLVMQAIKQLTADPNSTLTTETDDTATVDTGAVQFENNNAQRAYTALSATATEMNAEGTPFISSDASGMRFVAVGVYRISDNEFGVESQHSTLIADSTNEDYFNRFMESVYQGTYCDYFDIAVSFNDDGTVNAVYFASQSGSDCIGSYPTPAKSQCSSSLFTSITPHADVGVDECMTFYGY
ncbi:MAG: hypothetical protein QM689_08580 [Oscillospiraceae bacterium]